MANEPRERYFHYIEGDISYAQINALLAANQFPILDNGQLRPTKENGEKFMGIAFYPVKRYFFLGASNEQFETYDFAFRIVTMGSQGVAPTGFAFYPTGAAPTQLNANRVGTVDLSSIVSAGNPETTFNTLMNYNQSIEFELAFLDYEAIAAFRSNFPSSIAIFFSRASISMPISTSASASDYKNYRTLKFSPTNPAPTPGNQQPAGVEDVAYRLGVPCPPVWYQSSVTESRVAGGDDSLIPAMHAFKQDPQGGGQSDPMCSCNINTTKLHEEMVNGGYIKNEFTRPVNLLRLMLIRLLVWLLIFASAATLIGLLHRTGKG